MLFKVDFGGKKTIIESQTLMFENNSIKLKVGEYEVDVLTAKDLWHIKRNILEKVELLERVKFLEEVFSMIESQIKNNVKIVDVSKIVSELIDNKTEV